jgi:glucans biosynthesis protein
MSRARDTVSMQASPRCGAQTRNGEACRAPALRGRTRCRMHGGARGSGAPFGNGNAVKHGFFTGEAIDERRFVRTALMQAEDLLRQLAPESEAIRNSCESECTTAGTYSAPSHLTNDSK